MQGSCFYIVTGIIVLRLRQKCIDIAMQRNLVSKSTSVLWLLNYIRFTQMPLRDKQGSLSGRQDTISTARVHTE